VLEGLREQAEIEVHDLAGPGTVTLAHLVNLAAVYLRELALGLEAVPVAILMER
jgi:hypothetical protein